jgi:phospholipid/cholesterol/gamma-HCH transport system substrate-binding protein
METRAKFALIGLFTICVIAASFGFVFWFSGSRGGAKLKTYLVVFDTPVTGLSQGGSVLFNGIRVGDVTELSVHPRDPRLVVARVDIAPEIPIKVSTKARLEFSGLTGVASIQIFDSDPKSLDLKPKQEEAFPTLRAVPSPNLQSVLETLQTDGKHADEILLRVNQIVAENQAPIGRIIANVEKLSAALDAEKINSAVDNIAAIAAKLDVDKINHAISSIDTVVSSLDVSTVNHTLKSVDSFATALADNSDNLRIFAKDAVELVDKLKGTASDIDAVVTSNAPAFHDAVANLDKVLASIDAQKVGRTLDSLDKFSTTLGNHSEEVGDFIKSAETFAKALADNSDNVRLLAKDAVDLVDKLKGTASDIDAVVTSNSGPFHDAVANLDKILASVDTAKLSRTLDGLDKFSTTLGNHSDEAGDFIKDARDLAASLNRVSAQVEAFMSSGAPGSLTRSLANVEDITKHIDGTKLGEGLDNVEKFAKSLGDNTPRVDAIAKNANELFAKLNTSADKVDDILKGVNNLVNSPDGKSAFTEFAEASRSVRKLADDLDKRSAELFVNLNKFSGSGLRDIQQFAVDGRRTLGDISRTLQGVQRNPQQFIFGGKASLPEYGN